MTTPPATQMRRSSRSFSRAAAATLMLMNALVLAGWLSGFGRSGSPEPVTLTTPAATLFVLAGMALRLGAAQEFRRKLPLARACAISVAIAGLVIFGDSVVALIVPAGHLSAGKTLDRLRAALAGHLAPNTALSFLLVGGAMFLQTFQRPRPQKMAQLLVLAAALISLVAIIGHLYDFKPFYGVAHLLPMPLHAAVMFLLLCAGILVARPREGLMALVTSPSAGGFVIRWLPATVFAFLLFVGWLILAGYRANLYDVGFAVSVFVISSAVFFSFLIFWTAGSLDRADRRRSRAETELRMRARQQAGVVDLGRRALSGTDLPILTSEAATLIAETLAVEYCELLEVEPDGHQLLIIAAAGWAENQVGQVVSNGTNSIYGYTLACRVPVIVEDMAHDSRFSALPSRLKGMVSGLSVIVHGRLGPLGVLAAHTSRRRTFTKDDILFLQTMAAVLATAADRKRADEALRLSEEKFASAFRSCPDSIIVSTLAEGRIIDVNESFLRATGYRRDEVIGCEESRLSLWVDPGNRARLIERTAERESVSNEEASFRTGTGEVRVGLLSSELISLGGQGCLLTVMRDISELRSVERATKEANDKLARWVSELESRAHEMALLNDMGDLLQSCLTATEAYGIIAQFARQLFPADSGALLMLNGANELLEAVAIWGSLPPDDLIFAPENCWALRRGRPHAMTDLTAGLVCPHIGQPVSAAYFCVPMVAQGETLGVFHVREEKQQGLPLDGESKRRLVITVAEHIALALANLKLRETLRTQSIRDQLTGLFNRRYLEESLERELRRAARARRTVGLILLDLDHFKRINDTYGHEAGDRLLRAVSQFLQARTREEDIVCRYGGEEFVFVLPEASLEVTMHRAQELRDGIKRLATHYHGRILDGVSLSLGVAVFPEHGTTTSALLQAADAALYRAKAEGRDRLAIGQPAQH